MVRPSLYLKRRPQLVELLFFITMIIALNILNLQSFAPKCVKAFMAPQIRYIALSSVQYQGHISDISKQRCATPLLSFSPVVTRGSCRLHSSFSQHHHKPSNKFSKLRSQIVAVHRLGASASTEDSFPSNDPAVSVVEKEDTLISDGEVGLDVARRAVSVLAQNNKTWTRLAPIIELAASDSNGNSDGDKTMIKTMGGNKKDEKRTIADIGCDHGLLSIALAASGRYRGVVGIDVSSRALEDGALQFYRRMKHILIGGGVEHGDYRRSLDNLDQDQDKDLLLDLVLPVEFRVGNGLEPLCPGEADIVCIAGVGIHTMLSILTNHHDYDNESLRDKDETTMYDIDRIKCDKLLLQPTNSRPRHLIKLYRELQRFGFTLVDERVVYLASRWYITCAFERCNFVDDKNSELKFPGTILAARGDEEFNKYVKHHSVWLDSDIQKNSSLDKDDLLWLEYIQSKQ